MRAPSAQPDDRSRLEMGRDLKLILDAIDDGVFVYDGTGTLIHCNRKACDIFGHSAERMIGMNVADLVTFTIKEWAIPGFAGLSLEDIRRNKRRIEDYPEPGYMIFKCGGKMLYNGTYIRDENGAVRYAVYTIREATELAEARRKVEELQQLTNLYDEQLRTLNAQLLGPKFVAVSAAMKEVATRALKFSRLESNLLITGDTGSGKSLLARYIHSVGPRSSRPFQSLNCASLPEALVEAELFGYVEGAFTGSARGGRRGLIEAARGGTVFLDEIAEMPLPVQAKLLTAVEEKQIRRVGGSEPIPVDVRFIAATHRQNDELRQMLRADLYYRLSTLRLHVPPLSERVEDVPALIQQALRDYNQQNDTSIALSGEIVDRLQSHSLPGNIRQLRSLVWQAAAEADGRCRTVAWNDLPRSLQLDLEGRNSETGWAAPVAPPVATGDEAQFFHQLCARHGGSVPRMAAELGVHRTTVIRKLRSYGIEYARRHLRGRVVRAGAT